MIIKANPLKGTHIGGTYTHIPSISNYSQLGNEIFNFVTRRNSILSISFFPFLSSIMLAVPHFPQKTKKEERNID